MPWKTAYGFKNNIFKEFGEFSHNYLKVMLDNSSAYNVLAKGMYFWANIDNLILTFGLSTDCLKLSKFRIWFLKPAPVFV